MRRKLKNVRRTLGLDVSTVANKLGISESYYYKIEAGIRNPNMDLAKRLANLYGSSIEELFFSQELDTTSNNNKVC